jgi:hypothetical protein
VRLHGSQLLLVEHVQLQGGIRYAPQAGLQGLILRVRHIARSCCSIRLLRSSRDCRSPSSVSLSGHHARYATTGRGGGAQDMADIPAVLGNIHHDVQAGGACHFICPFMPISTSLMASCRWREDSSTP